MKPGAPWSVKGIDPKAREIAKANAHAQGKSLGEWMTEMILTAREGGEGPAALPPPGAGSGLPPSRGPQAAGPHTACPAATGSAAAPVPSQAAGAGGRAAGGPASQDDPRIAEALVELSRRLEQIEQRVTGGTQSLSRDVAVLREGLQNLGREFVATRRHTVAQQDAILKRTEQAIAVAGAANSGVAAVQSRLEGMPRLLAPAAQPPAAQQSSDPAASRPAAAGPPSSIQASSAQPSPGTQAAGASPQAQPRGPAPPPPPSPGPAAAQPPLAPSPAAAASPAAKAVPGPGMSPQAHTSQASPQHGSASQAGLPPQAPAAAPGGATPAPHPEPAPQGQAAAGRPEGAAPAAREVPAPRSEPASQGGQGSAPGRLPDEEVDDDAEYEIVEYELKEGEDPADYAGSDEYEVVVAEPVAGSPAAAPNVPAATRAATGGAAPVAALPGGPPALQAVEVPSRQPGAAGGGAAGPAGLRPQQGRRLRLPLGGQEGTDPDGDRARAARGMAVPEMPPGGAAPFRRPGGLPPLSGVDAEPQSGDGDDTGPKVDPLVAAVDRRAGAIAQQSQPESQPAPAFAMTWRKGLGQPPRPAASGSPEDPVKVAADWEKSGTEPGDAGASAAGPGHPDLADAEGMADPGGMTARPKAIGASAATAAPPPNGPAPGSPTDLPRPGAASAVPGPNRPPGVALSPGASGGRAAGGREGPALRGDHGERSPHATARDAALGTGPRRSRRSRRERRLERESAGASLADAADDRIGAELRSYAERPNGRNPRRRNLLLAGGGVLLVAVAIVALVVLDSFTAPPEIDYVALDAQQRAQEQQNAAGTAAGAGTAPGPAAGNPAAADPGASVDRTRTPPEGAPGDAGRDAAAADAGPGIEELRQASDGGSAQAAYELGLRLLDGIGVRRDPMAAAVQFQRAADQGYAPAQFALGVAYQQGEGVPRDLEQAAYWYAVAADQGNADAQFNFGTLYARGEGVEQDYYQAAKWYRRAADAGLSDAQFNYANMLETGLGTTQDREAAYRYYAMAAQAGDPVAAERERALAGELGPDAVARLQAASGPASPASADAEAGSTRADRGDAAGMAKAGEPAGPEAGATMQAAGRSGEGNGTPGASADPPAGRTGPQAGIAGPAGQTAMAEQGQAGQAPDNGPVDGPVDGPADGTASSGTGSDGAASADGRPIAGAAEVAELQGLLNGLGFEAGPADGVMGSRTRTAIAAFQEAAGLPANGEPSRSLLLELRQIAGTRP